MNCARAIVSVTALLPLLSFAQIVSFEKQEQGILVFEGDKKVLFYQTEPKSLYGNFGRANYIHPLYGLDGEILTEDFPGDHPHHRGIFWAWHQVLLQGAPMGDSWECRDFSWKVDKVAATASDTGLLIRSRVLWKSPLHTDKLGKEIPLLEEHTTIRVFPRVSNYRVIDFEISLKALIAELKLGGSSDDKGYGGFSVRMKLPDGLVFTSRDGRVTPDETAVTAANWMNISGPIGRDNGIGGILIIAMDKAHDQNQQWILRKKGSMQNPVYPGRIPVKIPEDSPILLKYRLVVYKGAITPQAIAKFQP